MAAEGVNGAFRSCSRWMTTNVAQVNMKNMTQFFKQAVPEVVGAGVFGGIAQSLITGHNLVVIGAAPVFLTSAVLRLSQFCIPPGGEVRGLKEVISIGAGTFLALANMSYMDLSPERIIIGALGAGVLSEIMSAIAIKAVNSNVGRRVSDAQDIAKRSLEFSNATALTSIGVSLIALGSITAESAYNPALHCAVLSATIYKAANFFGNYEKQKVQ
jgi:hypothetical protein